jgi:hypothetical protein
MARPVLQGLGVATALLMAWPSAALAARELAPSPPAAGMDAQLARGGGGGSGRGGGGRGGGGGGHGGHARTGFSGGGSFSRGNNRPSGGFSGGDRLNRVGNPSLSRPATRPGGGLERPVGGLERPSNGLQRPNGPKLPVDRVGDRPASLGDRNLNINREGDRSFNREGGRNLNGDRDRTLNLNSDRTLNLDRGDRSININRDWTREVNIDSINLRPGWARPGWGVARPWNWGWYGGWSRPPWGWWAANAAVWGISSLATAAIINDAVNDAVNQNVTSIVVPNTSYQLQIGTVQPYGNASVSFVVTANGTSYQVTADCNAGAINGRLPSSAEEAELLNAACQVAYGTAS